LGAENANSSELIILDRYNKVVFESKSFKGNSDLNNCTGWWDGRNSSGNELPPGIYYYQLTLNGDKVYKGYVVLKRQ
jgi:gliding motility-associated-like protein